MRKIVTTKTIQVSLTRELENSYLSYSIAIFNRALPSVVDGLKCAQRRIILGLKDLNLKPDGQYKKVSRLEGHVLGSYHPQGGCAGTAINMGQSTAFRYLLTDIHGNVGGSIQSGPSVGQSISEDAPAAARYLEVKSTPLTQRMLIDEIDKYSCDWRDNYDGSTQEVVEIVPTIPSLLVNGAQGIATGYACHHISYNLGEVIKGVVQYIKNPAITSKSLFKFIKGPDLPNGARILNDSSVYQAFDRGSGSLKVYGTWEIKKVSHGKRSLRDAIIITSLASGSSERFLEKLKEGVESEKIVGVIDAQDHSSRDGIEIEVILKSGTDPQVVISQLLAFTNLHDTIGVNATAISGGLPTTFGVKDIISEWYQARCKALKNRYEAECNRLRDKIHILDGLLIILADIDEVVKLIRSSKTKDTAAEKLKKRWKLSDIQVSSVLAMPLSRLVNAEKLELQSQKQDLEVQVALLIGIIENPAQMNNHIIAQVEALKVFVDARRTQIVDQSTIGAEKAKTIVKNGIRKVKMPSPKDKIKEEGKKLGMKRTELAKFFADNVGNTDLKTKWAEFKENWEHNRSLTTREGRAKRKITLESIKAAAIKRGLPKRGQYCWNKFIEGREKDKIRDLELALRDWMANIDAI
ncbi:MAG: Cyanophage [Pseudomonadota bacterium]|jgi:DNA gyrase subunit A